MRKGNKSIRLLLPVIVILMLVCMAQSENWPQWRGPELNGVSKETNLPDRWSLTENIAWSIVMPGPGNSTPVVFNNRIYLTTDVKGTTDLAAMCIDADSGKVLWQKNLAVGNKGIPNYNCTAPSAVTDGKIVCFMFSTGELAGLDMDGNVLWERNLVKEYGPFTIKWGYGSSPLLYKDKLYIVCLRTLEPYAFNGDAKGYKLDSYLLAVDPKTGKNIFKVERSSDATEEHLESYATPIVYEGQGRSEVVIVGGDFITGHNSETGEEAWRWKCNARKLGTYRRMVASPTVCGDLIVGMLPREAPMYAVKPGKGNMPDDSATWWYEASVPDVCCVLPYKGRIFVLNGNRKKMSCIDPSSGKEIWQSPMPGKDVYRASPTGADGKIYCIDRMGGVVVLDAGDEFKIISQAEMGGKPTHSTITVSNGRLFIRTAEKLFCVKK